MIYRLSILRISTRRIYLNYFSSRAGNDDYLLQSLRENKCRKKDNFLLTSQSSWIQNNVYQSRRKSLLLWLFGWVFYCDIEIFPIFHTHLRIDNMILYIVLIAYFLNEIPHKFIYEYLCNFWSNQFSLQVHLFHMLQTSQLYASKLTYNT